MQYEKVVKYSLILIATVAFFWAVYHARAFLVPLSFAAILAMLLVPISNRLERWGFHRIWSSLMSTLIVVVAAAAVVFLLSARANRFASDLPRLQQQITRQYQKLWQTTRDRWGIVLPAQIDSLVGGSSVSHPRSSPTGKSSAHHSSTSAREATHSQLASSEATPAGSASGGSAVPSGSSLSSIVSTVLSALSGTMAILGDVLLTLVYVFALLCYRDKFQEFLWRLTPDKEHPCIRRIVDNSSRVARKYLWGRLWLIIILAILYGIGFTVSGLQHALFLAVFAALFSIIPYIGNIIGVALPMLVALVSQSSLTLVLWVLGVWSVVQFFESYILEPLIVGSEVNLNPFFTIVALVAGSLLWGVPGLILAIPIMGIIRVLFDNIGPFQPYGYLIGQQKTASRWNKVFEKIKSR